MDALTENFDEVTVRAIRPHKWRMMWEELEAHIRKISASRPDQALTAHEIKQILESFKREKFW
jgi:hypothetical protein